MAAILASLEQLPFVKEISPDDWMAKGKTPDWYFNRGYEALKLIHDICWRNKLVPSSVLDFGCGHGNVARMLKAAYPKATIVGQDVDPVWLEWCEEKLQIQVVQSAERVADVEVINRFFDLIWVGSVFTHIPPNSAAYLFRVLSTGLKTNGILILTTAGNSVANGFKPGEEQFLEHDDAKQALISYQETGYGFAGYQGGRYVEWGRSLVSFDWMYEQAKTCGLRLIGFQEGGWGMRQDVYAFRPIG